MGPLAKRECELRPCSSSDPSTADHVRRPSTARLSSLWDAPDALDHGSIVSRVSPTTPRAALDLHRREGRDRAAAEMGPRAAHLLAGSASVTIYDSGSPRAREPTPRNDTHALLEACTQPPFDKNSLNSSSVASSIGVSTQAVLSSVLLTRRHGLLHHRTHFVARKRRQGLPHRVQRAPTLDKERPVRGETLTLNTC